MLLLAWGPAILVQLAHPLVAPRGRPAQGMFRTEHCGWRRRLHSTVDAMLRLSFGTERDAQVALESDQRDPRSRARTPARGRAATPGRTMWSLGEAKAPGRGSAHQCESAATLQRLPRPRPHQVQPTTGLAAPCTNRVDVFVRTGGPLWSDNLAQLLKATNRLQDAEPLSRRHVEISLDFTCRTGHPHPHPARLARPALSRSGRPKLSPVPIRELHATPGRGTHTRWSPCIVATKFPLFLAAGENGVRRLLDFRSQCCISRLLEAGCAVSSSSDRDDYVVASPFIPVRVEEVTERDFELRAAKLQRRF